jgi:beta-glucosidase
LGKDACHIRPLTTIGVECALLVEACANRLGLRACNAGKSDFLRLQRSGRQDAMPECMLTQADISMTPTQSPAPALCPPLSLSELAALCVGYGPGTPFSAFGDQNAPSTLADEAGNPLACNDHPTGMPGYVSPAIPEKGIHSIAYKDGPAGVGETAWPSEMLLACSFDETLCQRFGEAVASECRKQGVNVWLAPAVNLHRHPLCGRNFEYFSEDPLLTGRLACAILRGVQAKPGVLACPKHFVANEQETWRRGSARLGADAVDSVIAERTLRELYLLPFEMLVREGGARFLMTSFNKVNGTFTAESADLCTRILREEWGFDGVVVTDWGDMDAVADGANAVAAGNDVIMPGGPPVIAQIMKGYAEGRVTRENLETAVGRLLRVADALRGSEGEQ